MTPNQIFHVYMCILGQALLELKSASLHPLRSFSLDLSQYQYMNIVIVQASVVWVWVLQCISTCVGVASRDYTYTQNLRTWFRRTFNENLL